MRREEGRSSDDEGAAGSDGDPSNGVAAGNGPGAALAAGPALVSSRSLDVLIRPDAVSVLDYDLGNNLVSNLYLC